MIDHENKFIYIHIPKCGGTSVLTHLDSPDVNGDSHWHYNRKPINENLVQDYFVFTFVRNPWDRFVSEVNWLKHNRPNTNSMSFERICRKFKNNRFQKYIGKSLAKTHLIPQYDSASYAVRDISNVDFIGRFENLQEDFNTICDKIGIPRQQLPHTNTTKHKHYTEYYDDETRQIVAEKYAKDIEYFDYEFGE